LSRGLFGGTLNIPRGYIILSRIEQITRFQEWFQRLDNTPVDFERLDGIDIKKMGDILFELSVEIGIWFFGIFAIGSNMVFKSELVVESKCELVQSLFEECHQDRD
jgi:hypothetical protein